MSAVAAPIDRSWLKAKLTRACRVEPLAADRTDELLQFFRHAYADQPTARAFHDVAQIRRRWLWINQQPSAAWVCLKDGRIVGHLAATDATAVIAGHAVPIRWGRDLIVSPDARGTGAGPLLILSAVEAVAAPFLVAGLNDQIRHMYRRLGFRELGRIPLFVKVYDPRRFVDAMGWSGGRRWAAAVGLSALRMLPRPRRQPRLDVKPLDTFDERFDRWWAHVENGFPAVIRRSSEAMAWRYARHPEHAYTTLAAWSGSELRGVVIVRRGRSRGLPAGFITELLVANGDADAAHALLSEGERALRASPGEPLAFVRSAVRQPAQQRALVRAGFLSAPSPLHFMAAVSSDDAGFRAGSEGAWFVNGGNSDLDAI